MKKILGKDKDFGFRIDWGGYGCYAVTEELTG